MLISVFNTSRNYFGMKTAYKPAWYAHILVGFLYILMFGWAQLTYAAGPSTQCMTPQSFTVTSGGSRNVDLSSCSVFGLNGVSTAPSHGTLTNINPVTGNGTGQFTYTHNGDGATSDTFGVLDDSNGVVTFNVTITSATPTVTAVSPNSGTAAGGTSVTITGTNLTGATAVKFGGTNASSFFINSATSISATSPAHSSGVVDITVTTPGGTSSTGSADQFTYIAPPVANAVSTTVAYGSTNNPVTLNITGGSATSVAVASGASHGTATAIGTSITYTPTASYSGPDSFTYTATNSSGTSAPATVTITVSSPTITYAPSNPASGTVALPYSQSVASASGGTAPYTYALTSGALPAGLTLSSSGTISGTPTAGGLFNFSVTATDSSTGTGPFTRSSSSLSLAINVPTIAISPTTLTAATAQTAYSATLTASGGTSTYTYAITSGSLPAGLTLSSVGVLSGTPTVSGSFSFTVTATDSSTGTGPYTGSRSYTLSVAAPTVTLAPSTISAGTVGSSYSTTISATGGAAPYTYSVSAGALPSGMSLSFGGVLSGTPTAGGSFNFTIQATDNNTFTGTQSYSLTIAAPTIVISPTTLTAATAETAYSATLNASGGISTYTYAITSGSLPAGLTLSSAGVLSGTPTVSGSFSFTVTATDSSTGTGPFTGSRSYTLSIAAPAITLTPSSLTTNAKVSVAYSQQFTANGGIAPYTYATTAGSLPSGLTLSGSGLLSGTPTANGSFSFTITATDSNGFNGQQALSLTVDQAQPVAGDDNATTPANQAVTVNVTGNDSGPITSIAIATAPAHGTAFVNGLSVMYTPAPDYFGSDSFTYTATGPGGTSAPATVIITVTALAVPTLTDPTANVLAGQSVTIDATSGATGGPFTGATIVSTPSIGTAVVNGTDIVYTATAESSGTVTFSYTLANVFGASAPVIVTININPMPAAPVHNAVVAAGAIVSIDLTAGATGGPFTGANVVSISPSNAGTAVIRDVSGTAVSSRSSKGRAATMSSPDNPSFQLTFTAASTFSGAAVITYTLRNAHTVSAPGTITINVAARRDMSTDPEVTGLVNAQTNSVKRFASAQISNFTRRLESLHGSGWGRSSFGINLTQTKTTDLATRPDIKKEPWLDNDDDRLFGMALRSDMRKIAWRAQADERARWNSDSGMDNDMELAENDTETMITQLPTLTNHHDDSKQPLSLWVGGSIDYGEHNVNDGQSTYRFSTNGISLGGDYRINELVTLGVGGGFSRDSSDVGVKGTTSTAESVVGAVYGSFRPIKDVFIDGVLGYGTLNFKSNRYITDDGGFATGLRDGEQWFGAIVGGVEFQHDDWMWSPYGRLEMMTAQLHQYTETASDLNALTYFKQNVNSTNGVLGVRAEAQYKTSFGMLVPRTRIEFRHQFERQQDAGLAYADLAAEGPAYFVRTNDQNIGNWSAGLGAKLILHNGIGFSVEYNSNLNMNSGRSQSVMVLLEVPIE